MGHYPQGGGAGRRSHADVGVVSESGCGPGVSSASGGCGQAASGGDGRGPGRERLHAAAGAKMAGKQIDLRFSRTTSSNKNPVEAIRDTPWQKRA